MALINNITKDMIFPYGEENAVASFHKWCQDVFEPAYPVFFDKDGAEFSVRNLTKFPSILIQQIDTQDLTTTYFGGKNNYASLLFYVYCNHSLKNGGSRRLLRRMRDQVSSALKLAGVTLPGAADVKFPPMYMWDFSKKPIEKLSTCLTLKPGIQQRFTQEDDVLQQELMITLSFMEQFV